MVIIILARVAIVFSKLKFELLIKGITASTVSTDKTTILIQSKPSTANLNDEK